MSGTSADGVDAALVRVGVDAHDLDLLAFGTQPIEDELRARIHGLLGGPVDLRDLLRLDREIGERFSAAALAVLARAGVSPSGVAGIGSHGQTVAHHPGDPVRGTLQLGSAAVIHERTGIPVISDFRSGDIAAGGEGAPLTPFLHHAYFARGGERRAILNIGGFTNVTFLDGEDPGGCIAFDPGPGNALLDGAVRVLSEGRERFDRDGGRSRRGRVIGEALGALLDDPYFARLPPKSTGHEGFGEKFLAAARERVASAGGGPDDLLATLAALTIESVALAAERFFPAPAERWIVYGGGARNPVLVEGLRGRLAPAPVETTDAHGLPSDAVEAVAFAALGHASACGVPSNVPRATGAARAVSLGSATPPAAFAGRATDQT